jgi:dolichyl-phosphate-mannose-protein mannosyltransferase
MLQLLNPVALGLLATVWLGHGAFTKQHWIFDEHRYVSAARSLKTDQPVNENWSHPPLGKWILAQSIKLFGDTPRGWRSVSVGSGVGLCLLLAALGYSLRSRWWDYWLAGFLALTSCSLFVQSRLANLDSLMALFFLLGLFPYLRWVLGQRPYLGHRLWDILAVGVLWGLSLACKWALAVAMGYLWIFALAVSGCLRFWQTKKTCVWALAIPGAAVLTYLSVVLLTLTGAVHPRYAAGLKNTDFWNPPKDSVRYQSVLDLLQLNLRMVQAQMNFHNEITLDHSPWWQWPVLTRGTFYEAKAESKTPESAAEQKIAITVYFLNPLFQWFGLFSVLFFLLRFVRERKVHREFSLAVVFLVAWLSWALIPRQTQFAYYYFTASLFFAPLIVAALGYGIIPRQIRWCLGFFLIVACLAVVVWTYPVLVGEAMNRYEIYQKLFFLTGSTV